MITRYFHDAPTQTVYRVVVCAAPANKHGDFWTVSSDIEWRSVVGQETEEGERVFEGIDGRERGLRARDEREAERLFLLRGSPAPLPASAVEVTADQYRSLWAMYKRETMPL